MLNQSEQDDIEALIDRYSMSAVLIAMHDIAHGKGEHLAFTWQDTGGAKPWLKAARILDKAAHAVDALAIP